MDRVQYKVGILAKKLLISFVAVFLPVLLDQLKAGAWDSKTLILAAVSAFLAAVGIDLDTFQAAKKRAARR